MEFKDYYQTLGVAQDASQDDIRRAYRRLARKYHPDVSKEPNAEARFKEVGEAYEVLKDPEKRAAYDRFGQQWQTGQGFEPPPDWDTGFEFSGGGYTDAGAFSDFFESLFGRAAQGGPRARYGPGGFRARGEDHHARIRISLDDAYRGATRAITLRMPHVGEHGELTTQTRTLNVRIPPGVREGQRIRLAGEGESGIGGGPKGDLYLEVAYEPHPLFRAEGRDVYLTLPITPWEAALGQRVTVPTLGGRVGLRVPEGAQSGQKLRLKGRGLPGDPPGDQYVVLQIQTPKATTDEARALYKHLAETLPFNPRAHWEGEGA